jgi:hypothetical protein
MQDDQIFQNFSVNKNVLDQQIERAKKGIYERGSDGELHEISVTNGWYNGEEILLYAATQVEIEGFYALIDSSVELIQYDDLLNIIAEEAIYYLYGYKTLDEVTDLIQNRAQIYVSENQ